MFFFDGVTWNPSWMQWNYRQGVLGFLFYLTLQNISFSQRSEMADGEHENIFQQ